MVKIFKHYVSTGICSRDLYCTSSMVLFSANTTSVDKSRKHHFLYASVAYKRAALNAIEYLARFGYSKEQVYLLLSCCPWDGRISGIVASPNAVAILAIPTTIFDQDDMEAMVAAPVEDEQLAKSSTQVVFHVLSSSSKFFHNVGLQSVSKTSLVSAKVQEL